MKFILLYFLTPRSDGKRSFCHQWCTQNGTTTHTRSMTPTALQALKLKSIQHTPDWVSLLVFFFLFPPSFFSVRIFLLTFAEEAFFSSRGCFSGEIGRAHV